VSITAWGATVAQVAVADRQAGVPEVVTDDVDRRALPRELGGVSVPKAVGVHPPVDPGLAGEARASATGMSIGPSGGGLLSRSPGKGRR